jgi:pentatricopeptide repeat protein
MKLPQYITIDEVKRVCKELKISDWSSIRDYKVMTKEAKIILSKVNTEKMSIPLEAFRRGLEVELEHGTRFKDANVTNNHPLLTGKIVLAHLKEMMDYYERLEVAELEGDIFKAVKAGNFEKVKKYFKRLVKAKIELSALESLNMK